MEGETLDCSLIILHQLYIVRLIYKVFSSQCFILFWILPLLLIIFYFSLLPPVWCAKSVICKFRLPPKALVRSVDFIQSWISDKEKKKEKLISEQLNQFYTKLQEGGMGNFFLTVFTDSTRKFFVIWQSDIIMYPSRKFQLHDFFLFCNIGTMTVPWNKKKNVEL